MGTDASRLSRVRKTDILIAEKEVKGDINLVQNRNLRVGIYPAPWQRTKEKKLKTDGFVGTIRYIKISDKAKVK